MNRKPFDQKLFDQNDSAARHAVTQYLLDTEDCTVEENPDRYGVDLFMRGGLGDRAIEVEVKRVWVTNPFPWDTIQLPERKGKYREQGLPVDYWLLRRDLEYAIVVGDWLLDEYHPVEVPNKYVAKGEKFWQIPLIRCRGVKLT